AAGGLTPPRLRGGDPSAGGGGDEAARGDGRRRPTAADLRADRQASGPGLLGRAASSRGPMRDGVPPWGAGPRRAGARRGVGAQNCLRWRLEGMRNALRYLVTVRRATGKPCLPSSSTISSSESGACLSSLAMISSSFCLIVSQATSSPSAVVVPPPKKRF